MKALIAIAVLAASAPALAAASEDGAHNPQDSRMICRHMRPHTSETRLGTQRVCHTAAEWRTIQENGAGTADMSTEFHDNRPVIGQLGRSNRPN